MQVCVWMCAHKQRREHHQRPVITRNTPTSGSRLQSCSKQMGSLRRQTSSKPAEREIIILDAGLKPPPPDITPISNLADSFTAAPLSSWQLAARLFSKASRFSNGASKKKSFSSLFCLFNTCITFFIFSSLWSCMRSHCSQLYFELKIAQAFFLLNLSILWACVDCLLWRCNNCILFSSEFKPTWKMTFVDQMSPPPPQNSHFKRSQLSDVG